MQGDELAAHHLQFSQGLGAVQLDQHVTGLHHVAVAHMQRLDHAAFEVLNRLAVTFHRDDTGSQRSTVERREYSPGAEQAEGQEKNRVADIANRAIIDLWLRSFEAGSCLYGLFHFCSHYIHPLRIADSRLHCRSLLSFLQLDQHLIASPEYHHCTIAQHHQLVDGS
ncbi:hypothetical protein D3C78_1277280 [compost metagenome]